ncbi:MAG TPA: Rieske (2Fe-2S) protein [Bacteroidia bacterium]|jgi:Rieske Fe-S protein|nr:Rieske (2Fe-2S) protein [Bacteroidia bacterium]
MLASIKIGNKAGFLKPDRSFKLDISNPSNRALERLGGFIYNNGAIIIHLTPDTYKAFSYICTHYGCIMGYDENSNTLVCPCQCGMYDLEGNAISGVPVKPLRQFEVSKEGNVLTITDNNDE